MENENKRLHEWFGNCWHNFSYNGDGGGKTLPSATCLGICGQTFKLVHCPNAGGPNYSTESGFFALLSGLRKKQIGVTLMQNSEGATVMLSAWNPAHAGFIYIGKADTIELALFKAAIKAMDGEEGTE